MRTFLFFIILLSNVYGHSQNLSLSELFAICNKPNWDEVNEFMLKKSWEYHESSKGDDTHYNTITWSYEKEYFGDKAKGWFYLYTYEGFPNKIVYSFFNIAAYNTIKNGISASGMKLFDNSIEDNEIETQYSGSNFIVTVRIAKREKEGDYYKDNTITAYTITVIKKAGIYDKDNGLKKTFDSYGNLESEFTLKDGKLNGVANAYYSNGQLKVTSNFVNDNKNGNSKEYDELGNLTAEYNYLDGELNGRYKIYENGRLKITGSLLNGVKNGVFKEYNDEGLIEEEYNIKLDLLNGTYKAYYYGEGKLFAKVTGCYDNGHKTGLWQTIKVNEKETELIEYKTYLNDEKHGACKEVSKDSIIFCTYKNGVLNGQYKIYKSFQAWLLGGLHGDTTNCPLMVSGSYNEGKRNGHWKYYSMARGLIKEGRYFNDLESGEWKYYFDNYVDEKNKPLPYSGKLFLIENYESGKKNGKETRYATLERKKAPCANSENGNSNPVDTCHQLLYQKIFQTAHYRNDELYGPFEHKDSSGITTFKGNFIHGKKDGIWLESYVSKDINDKNYYTFLRGNYTNELASGIWEEFSEEGFVYTKYLYSHGKLNGKTISYNNNNKPREEKIFSDGKLKLLNVYDSIGSSIISSYEIIYESNYDIKCRRTVFIPDGKVSQEYLLIKEDGKEIDHNFFQLVFYLSTEENSDFSSGYPDGEFKLYDKNNKIFVEGNVHKKDKIGRWKTYYYDSNIYSEQEFTGNDGGEIKYLVIGTSQPFSGKFIQKYDTGKIKYEFKISEGLREGKSKYYDENGKVTKIEKYEKGIIQKSLE